MSDEKPVAGGATPGSGDDASARGGASAGSGASGGAGGSAGAAASGGESFAAAVEAFARAVVSGDPVPADRPARSGAVPVPPADRPGWSGAVPVTPADRPGRSGAVPAAPADRSGKPGAVSAAPVEQPERSGASLGPVQRSSGDETREPGPGGRADAAVSARGDVASPGEPLPDAQVDDAPRPLGVARAGTGDARVDGLLGRLADLDELPVAEHQGVYEESHEGLRAVLAALDAAQGPPPPPAR